MADRWIDFDRLLVSSRDVMKVSQEEDSDGFFIVFETSNGKYYRRSTEEKYLLFLAELTSAHTYTIRMLDYGD